MRRVGFAALAGALAGGLWLLLTLGGIKLFAERGCAERGCTAEGFQCLGRAIMVMFVAVPLALLAAWVLLRLLNVRPAWPVALVAPAFLGALAWLLLLAFPQHPVFAVAIPISYAAAAFVTDGQIRPQWRILATAAILLLYPLAISLR